MARAGSNERPPVQLGVCTISESTTSVLSLFVKIHPALFCMVRIGPARGSSGLNPTECTNFLVRIRVIVISTYIASRQQSGLPVRADSYYPSSLYLSLFA
jgi:hypothetical protein